MKIIKNYGEESDGEVGGLTPGTPGNLSTGSVMQMSEGFGSGPFHYRLDPRS